MISTQATPLTQWLRRILRTPLAIISSQADVERAGESGELALLLRQDPLLTMRLFQAAKHIPKGEPIATATELVELLGTRQIVALCKNMPRIDQQNPLHQGLLRSIGDTLLAAELLQRWFEWRHIEFTEADFWHTVFDGAPIFAMWWTDPLIMEGADHNTADTKSIQQKIATGLECRYLQILEAMQVQWEIPVALNLATSTSPKASALKFFLPFSHEIAHASRRSWRSDQFLDACRRGGVALGINQFSQQLRCWLLDIAHKTPNNLANHAMRQLIADQPHENKIVPRLAAKKAADIDPFALTELLQKMHPRQLAYVDQIDLFDGLMSGLQQILHAKMCIITAPHGERYDVLTWRGISRPTQGFESNKVFTKLSSQSVSLWINDKNRKSTTPVLPKALQGLASENDLMLRSVVIEGKCKAIIIAAFEQATPDYYTNFRQLGTSFGQALQAL